MFSHRCPIACRHCGILSGPDNHDAMPPGLPERLIDEAAMLDPRPATIVFTGGEAMMFPDRLAALLDRANRHGFATRVITNGFWARNPDSGRRLLHRLRLAGLDALNFSADRFHLEFLEARVLRDAMAIAAELGFPIIVNMVINRQEDPVAAFASLYGIDPARVRLFDEDELLAQMASGSVPPALFESINLSCGRLVGQGRAALYPEEHLLSPLGDFGYAPCQEVVHRPVVYPDGSFQACCCAGGRIAAFTVGNVHHTPLAELFDTMRALPHFAMINRFGPRALLDAVIEVGALPAPDKAARYASICDVCTAAQCNSTSADGATADAVRLWLLKRIIRQGAPMAVPADA
jgi:hypothetical protein